jgi:hypothetical protein
MNDKQQWWQKNGDELATAAYAAVREILQEDDTRRHDLEAYESIYNDEACSYYEGIRFARHGKSRLPVLPGMVDATLSRIARAKPLPSVLTTDGNYKLKRRARLKTKWLSGMFKKLDAHEKLKDNLRDALVFGTGATKVAYDAEAGEFTLERVWCGNLHVPPLEAKHDCVRTLYQTMAVDRHVLADRYKKHKDWILSHDCKPYTDHGHELGASDLVGVVESWRIGTKTTPGRHAICLDGKCLFEEEWTSKRFPFVLIRWRKKSRQFWGQGMVESAAGLQSLLNTTAETLEKCFRLTFPFIAYEKNSGFDAERLSNEIMMAYPYTGTPPQVINPPPFAVGSVEYLQHLKQWIYETQGVSELAAASHKPAGLNSGKALLVFQDVESERFLIQGREFEQAHVLLAELIIEIAEDIYKTESRAEALKALGGRKGLEAIEFEDVRFEDHPWALQVYPVTSLSSSPSGRLEQLQTLIELGAINDPAQVRELLDYPDLERYTSVESAQRDLAEKMIDHALDKHEALPANPYMDLPYTMKRAVLELNLAEMEGAPEQSKEALREFIGHVEMLIEQEQAQAEEAAMAAQAEAGAEMGGAPMMEEPMPDEMGMDPALAEGMI